MDVSEADGREADASLSTTMDHSASLGADEYAQIIQHCGILYVHVRSVCRLFLRLWSEPATWAECAVTWSCDVGSLSFLFHHGFPALARVSSLDTHAIARKIFDCDAAEFQRLHDELSLRRFNAMPSVNSCRSPVRGWWTPPGGFVGVSENAQVKGPVARRRDEFIPGMAAVCGDGPLPRDAQGRRSFGLRIEETSAVVGGGIYVGFVATPPSEIRFDDATEMWDTACMWRLVGKHCYANVPYGARKLHDEKRVRNPEGVRWGTDELHVGDELVLTALPSYGMRLAATLNGRDVVLPMPMPRCSFAMELFPYVAVCGRVTAVRLLVGERGAEGPPP
jgi:hypothetical protein